MLITFLTGTLATKLMWFAILLKYDNCLFLLDISLKIFIVLFNDKLAPKVKVFSFKM